MRDKRFIAEHRGGSLKKEQHQQLQLWACACAGNVLPLFGKTTDQRLIHALYVAREWTRDRASAGDARKAALDALTVARILTDP